MSDSFLGVLHFAAAIERDPARMKLLLDMADRLRQEVEVFAETASTENLRILNSSFAEAHRLLGFDPPKPKSTK